MSESESHERLELQDFGIAKTFLMEAAKQGQADAIIKVFEVEAFHEEPRGDIRRLMIMPVLRIAFNNNDLDLIARMMPYAQMRSKENFITMLEDAAKTGNGEIVRAIWNGLGFETIAISPKLSAKVQPHVTASRPEMVESELDVELFLSLLETGDFQAISDAIGDASVESLCVTEVVDAIMRTGNDEIIYIFAEKASAQPAVVENPLFHAWATKNLGTDVVAPIEPSSE